MRIAVVTSEVAPFSKTGGLADVCAALPAEFEKAGHDVIVISPLHISARKHGVQSSPLRVRVPLHGGTIEAGIAQSGRHWFLEHEGFFNREGLYGTPEADFPDNATRFAFLARGAMELLKALNWRPDIVHSHDWQSGLAGVYLRTVYRDAFPRTRAVFTVHNMAYQGLFWPLDLPVFGLDWSLFNWKQLEFFGKFSFLKAGLVFSDAITTVSPTYAKEIATPELGCGMEGVIRERARFVHGILNGIDAEEWDPKTDKHLPATYSARSLTGKAKCKAALQKRLNLPVTPAPLLGFVGRLAEQKGIDILVRAAEYFTQLDMQFAILGAGEARFREPLERLGRLYPEKLSVTIAFDDALAHLVEAGSDFFVMPSRYEPCGLNQLYSLRYGAVPIVRRTGGLADTVVEGKTGIVFESFSTEGLVEAIERALVLYDEKKRFQAVQREGMKQDFSWSRSAKTYLELFERVLAGPLR